MGQVLVTGAAGFIGSHLTERLLARGESVVGIDNFDPYYPRAIKERNIAAARQSPRFALIEADLRDPAVAAAVFERYRPDRVVHLAAKAGVRPSIEAPAAYAEVNYLATVHLLAACAAASNVQHFVFGSSSSVYGNAGKVPFAEDDRTDTPESPYGATKKAAEVMCAAYQRLTGIPVTCLRFFTVFGPRQRPDLAIHKFAHLIEAGRPVPLFGDGTTSRDYTYVDDIVDGVLAALDRPGAFSLYNLGRGGPVSLLDMVRALEVALGKTAALDWLPEQPGDVQTTFADISQAKAALGYEPRVDFDEGVRRFVEWFRAVEGSSDEG